MREFDKCYVVSFDELSLFMGQLFSSATAAFRRSLSLCSIVHSSSMYAVVCLSFPHGQFGASMILNLWRYDFVAVARNHCCEVLCKVYFRV